MKKNYKGINQMLDVSVVVPCYNDGKYLQEALDSVLAQSYQKFEIIIADDGSDDAYTKQILSQINHPKIKLLRLEKNSGPSIARNVAIDASVGKYILPLDADDKIAPTYLEKAKNILEQHSKIGIVYCKAEFFGLQEGVWDLPDYSFEDILIDNMIFATAMFRKREWKNVGGYNENMVFGLEDYDFWLSLIERNFGVHQIDEILFSYRKKSDSRTHKLSRENKKQLETYMIMVHNHIDLYADNVDVVVKKLKESLTNVSRLTHKVSKQESFILSLREQSICNKLLYQADVFKNVIKQAIKKIINFD